MKTSEISIGKCIALIIATMIPLTAAIAQQPSDVEGSKDHPMVSRFEGAAIAFYKETKFGTYKLPVDDKGKINFNSPMILKGKVTRIQYSVSSDNNPEYILHNYIQAFEDAGFSIMVSAANEELGVGDRSQDWNKRYYSSGDAYFTNALNNGKFGLKHQIPNWKSEQAFIAANGEKDGKLIYISIYAVNHDSYTLINQDVIEVEAPKTGLVTAEKISKGIETEGHVAVYGIYFDTGQSAIKAGSEAAMKNIAEYLNSVEGKKFIIVGHTDNTGGLSENMTLSESRAKSVMDKLINSYGVNTEKLSAYGVASLSPVASNATDEGRAKNRRVEIVEK